MREIAASANPSSAHAEEGEGGVLFEKGMGGNLEDQMPLVRGDFHQCDPGTPLSRIRINGRSPICSTPKYSS